MAPPTIHILPEQVASQIAAGEVVERPASAVKELIENSIDAGARSLSVEVQKGGHELIAVSDDGCGMAREDAILSLRRHATSKIHCASDLESIRTMGFRGEALASIASVSHLDLKTRQAADQAGISLSTVAGKLLDERSVGMAPGTRIEVRRLFFNTPARLKFLKTIATEQSTIAQTIQRQGLANPEIALRCEADGRTIIELPRASGTLERLRQVLGSKLANEMLGFALERDGAAAWGFLTNSQVSFATNRMVQTFVNRRPVRDPLLIRAVMQAYATMIPRGRWPAAALFLELRPGDVDVNVHPMKTEVRLRNSGAVFELVYHAIRDRLADQTQPSNIPAEVEKRVSSPLDGTTVIISDARSSMEQTERALRLTMDVPAAPNAEQRLLGLSYGRGSKASTSSFANPLPATAGTDAKREIPNYSQLRVIGQVFAGYIALEANEGLILVDQHAAHERITFERLRAQLRAGQIIVQSRLVPETIELNPVRAGWVHAALPQLAALGFAVEIFGTSTLVLKGAPAVFGPDAGPALLSELIDTMAAPRSEVGGEEAFEELLKELACRGSIRVGRALQQQEIRELLSELDRTEFKTNCPHGRPVHIELGRGHIERMFKR